MVNLDKAKGQQPGRRTLRIPAIRLDLGTEDAIAYAIAYPALQGLHGRNANACALEIASDNSTSVCCGEADIAGKGLAGAFALNIKTHGCPLARVDSNAFFAGEAFFSGSGAHTIYTGVTPDLANYYKYFRVQLWSAGDRLRGLLMTMSFAGRLPNPNFNNCRKL